MAPVGGLFVPPGTHEAATVGLVRVMLLVELVLELVLGLDVVELVELVLGFDEVAVVPVAVVLEFVPVVPVLLVLVPLVSHGPATVGLGMPGVMVGVPPAGFVVVLGV